MIFMTFKIASEEETNMNKVKLFFCTLALIGMLSLSGMSSEHNKKSESFKGYPLVYEADFSQGLDHWEFKDPNAWKVIEDDGQKVMASVEDSDYDPPVRSPENIAILKDLVVSDFVIVAEMKSTQPAYNHRDMCVIFGYQGPAHYYYTHIAPAPNTDMHANSIFIVNDEPRKSFAHKRNNGTAWKEDTYHKVMVVRDSKTGTIDVYFDNMKKPILQGKDTSFKKGRVGVGSFDDIGNIKTFKVFGIKMN